MEEYVMLLLLRSSFLIVDPLIGMRSHGYWCCHFTGQKNFVVSWPHNLIDGFVGTGQSLRRMQAAAPPLLSSW